MYPFIRFSDTQVLPTYNLMAECGLLAAFLCFYSAAKKRKIPAGVVDDMSVLFVFIALAAGLSAVLLNNLEHGRWDFSSPRAFVSGFTFYGGLLGGGLVACAGCFLLGRRQKLTAALLDILAVSVMIGHSLGRIGCFLTGCCYGKETTGFLGILYPVDGTWVRVYPVQLYESAFLLLLFLYSYRHAAHSLERYLIAYGIFRFFIEFIRGDNRGVQFILSPSQWLSILLMVIGVTLVVVRRGMKNRPSVAGLPGYDSEGDLCRRKVIQRIIIINIEAGR